MRDGFRIFDIDRHVYEPMDLWPTYLEARFRSLAPSFAYLDRGEPLSERMSLRTPDGLMPLPP